MAEGDGVLYVVFMGTKHVRDWLTDANVRQVPLTPPGDGAAVHKVYTPTPLTPLRTPPRPLCTRGRCPPRFTVA